MFLEKYGNILTKQALMPVDVNADPRSFNGSWEPWLIGGAPGSLVYGGTGAAAVLSTVAVCAHIGMVLLIVGLRAFLWLKDTTTASNNAANYYRANDKKCETSDGVCCGDQRADDDDDDEYEDDLVEISFIDDD